MAGSLIRCLTPDGIAELLDFLRGLREDGRIPPPTHLLTDPHVSRPLSLAEATVERRRFVSRRAFAQYIDGRFREAGFVDTADENGMWEWLSLYYFDEVCPLVDGSRQPGVDHRHLVVRNVVKQSRRHLLRGPYLLFRDFAGGPDGELDLLLSAALPVYDAAATSLGERPRIAASRGALTAAGRLYFDRATGQHRHGYTDDGDGVRAFCRFVNNLPRYFDLATMSADTVIDLLPERFDRWKGQAGDSRSESSQIFASLGDRALPTAGVELAGMLGGLLQDVESRRMAERHARVRSDLFRAGVLGAYRSTCAISGLELTCSTQHGETCEVEAAHVIPVAHGGRDLIQNGLALNRTIHWAFDNGMLWIDESGCIAVSGDVARDSRNIWLRQFRGRPLSVPVDPALHPHRDALRWHARHVAAVYGMPAALWS